MSADTTPISPARFAAALKDLSIQSLHLKVLEIRNSIAHLQYSNDQLKPFAEGTSTATDSSSTGEPDQDCVDAIRENEQVMSRMAERIALVRMEVEERGASWAEFESKEETEAAAARAREEQEREEQQQQQRNGASPWTDGTFQTGVIRDGEVVLDEQAGVRTANAASNGPATNGGSLSDEQLRAAMEERMRQMSTEDEDGGMHL